MNNAQNIEYIGSHLMQQNQTLAVAESVTAGNLQAAISLGENTMKFFQGGITAYNLGQKTRHLKVDPIHALACNCVSESVAAAMAIEVTDLFSSTWGIGVTGYAAPVPECDVHDLFAFVAFAFKGKVIYNERLTSKTMAPREVQQHYVNEILKAFCGVLK